MSYWWLSFCDVDKPIGEKCLGVSIIEAEDFLAAVRLAHFRCVNPGGQVVGRSFESFDDLPELPPGAKMETNRLYSPKELFAMGFRTLGELTDENGELSPEVGDVAQ